MADDSELERTEPATGRRIQRAREEGQVIQSRELGTFVSLLVAVGTLLLMGGHFMERLTALLRHGFSFDRARAFDPGLMLTHAAQDFGEALIVFLPLFVLIFLAALAAPLLLAGWNFTLKPLSPKFEKLDPIKGIKRLFSLNALVELAKAVLKALVIGGVAIWAMSLYLDELFALPGESLGSALAHAGGMILIVALAVVGAFGLVALVDVPYQIWQYGKNLRMTKEEVKQEHKETEGDPQIKARIRALQREAARRRMMAAVPKADVIVTNPTHFAVALHYEQGRMPAPRVVAKGAGLVAARIVELGREHAVPILEAPPLARALYRHSEVGDEIPQRLYTAVAEVLAYVYQLKRPATATAMPAPPRNLPVPEDMGRELPGEAA